MQGRESCERVVFLCFDRMEKGLEFREVALSVDGIGGKDGGEVVGGLKMDGVERGWMHFLEGDAEKMSGAGNEGKVFCLGEMVGAGMGVNGQAVLSMCPRVIRGEFESVEDVGMLEHEEEGVCGKRLTGDVGWGTKKIADEVKRMDVEVEGRIAFEVGACEVVEVVVEKMCVEKTLFEELDGGGSVVKCSSGTTSDTSMMPTSMQRLNRWNVSLLRKKKKQL